MTARRRDAGRPRGARVAEAILAATLEELALVGLDGVSVARVAARADVHKTSVYRRWPTREALVVAAFEHVVHRVESAAGAAGVADTGSLRGDLRALLRQVGDVLTSPWGRSLLRAASSDEGAVVAAAVAARRSATLDPVRQVVERARDRGEWRAGADVDALLSAAAGAVLHRVLLERDAVTDTWLEGLLDLLEAGFRPR